MSDVVLINRLTTLAPYYHPSEIILGRALEAVRDEFPRESYTLITKTGKYGPKVKDHIYDSETTRQSVERSLKRLHTDYLDVVCEHHTQDGVICCHVLTLDKTFTMSSIMRMTLFPVRQAFPSRHSMIPLNANNSTSIHRTSH